MRGGVQLIIALVYVDFLLTFTTAMRCDRTPEGIVNTKSPPDGRFSLKISGNPDKYVPGTAYTISIHGPRNLQMPQKFTGFSLVVESLSPFRPRNTHELHTPQVGFFQLFADALVTHSEKCPNMVKHTSTIPKAEVQVRWTAPPPGSGCITFKATVVEHRDVWFQDDGPLTKTLCEDIQENHDTQPAVLEECCACNEAKYEVAFEGMWSRHTHPKDFPSNSWLTRFSDVIGASHTTHYRFWDYGTIASEGLRQVAESGSTRMLESELKSHSQNIRTIIKARGISYPNVTGKTFAVFRVDRRHHLMSVVSMIDPSPDWIVGVSGLELCLKNCSWVESKVLNLYPWDAGTDSGVTYISPDMPTVPRDNIRRITSSFPNDGRSPFFDPTGDEMKPLARLHLTRQRIYPQKCDDTADSLASIESEVCSVGEWTDWNECSVTCGTGIKIRQRFYLDQNRAVEQGCRKKLTDRSVCYGERACWPPPRVEMTTEDPFCALTQWGDWSRCSQSCGTGFRIRYRNLQSKSKSAWKQCGSYNLELQQTVMCYSWSGLCQIAGITLVENPVTEQNELCEMTNWSEWSPCNVTSGTGTQVRTRMLLRYSGIQETTTPESNDEVKGVSEEEENEGIKEDKEDICPDISRREEIECTVSRELTPQEAREVCQLPKDVGPCHSFLKKYFFDTATQQCKEFTWGCRGNRNKFDTLEECEKTCQSFRDSTEVETTTPVLEEDKDLKFTSLTIGTQSPIVDCKTSRWTDWTTCSVSCGCGYKFKSRTIRKHPKNGGKACPKKLHKTKRCKCRSCSEKSNGESEENREENQEETESDCVYTSWSPWSQCTATCGNEAVQQRTRLVDYEKTTQGTQCRDRVRNRKCQLLPCKI